MRSQRTLEVGSGEVVEPNSEPVGSVTGIALAESQGNVRENRGYRGCESLTQLAPHGTSEGWAKRFSLDSLG